MADTLGDQIYKDIIAYTNDVVRKADKSAKEIQRQMVPMATGASPVRQYSTHTQEVSNITVHRSLTAVSRSYLSEFIFSRISWIIKAFNEIPLLSAYAFHSSFVPFGARTLISSVFSAIYFFMAFLLRSYGVLAIPVTLLHKVLYHILHMSTICKATIFPLKYLAIIHITYSGHMYCNIITAKMKGGKTMSKKKKKNRSRGDQSSRAEAKTVSKAAVFASIAQAIYFIIKIVKELKE